MFRGVWCLVPAILLIVMSAPAAAQLEGGAIAGVVLDQSGSAMPEVLVTLEGPVLLQPLRTLTAENGSYQFLSVAVGAYSVTFSRPGFQTVVRPAVRVTTGFHVQLDVQLPVSGVAATVTVETSAPLVSALGTGARQTFDHTSLQRLPTARDPWALLYQTPGVALDRENIGGSQSGQQPNYVSRGASPFSTKWALDGLDITDMSFTGASPTYFDFDAFEEISVATAGVDVTQQTGGVGITLVTRSGSDTLRGSARFFGADDALASSNVSDALRARGATSGNPVQRLRELGTELGGPLRRGRAWVWGGIGYRDISVGVNNFFQPTAACAPVRATPVAFPLQQVNDCLFTDRTTLLNTNLKTDVRLGAGHTLTAFYSTSRRHRNARAADDLHPFETTWRDTPAPAGVGPRGWNTGPTPVLRISDRWAASDRLFLEAQYGHVGNNFMVDFQDPALVDVQPSLEITTGLNGRSTVRGINVRPINSVDVSAVAFRPRAVGGDHLITIGGRWRDAYTYAHVQRGGRATARFFNGVAAEADLSRDAKLRFRLVDHALYFQDVYRRQRLTLVAGLRYDRQHDRALSSDVVANPLLPAWLPAAVFPGADPGVVFHDLSPRAGLNFDLFGTATPRLRVNAARYYGQVGSGGVATAVNPLGQTTVRFPWSDRNGDGFIQTEEIDTTRLLAFSGSYDPADPGRVNVSNSVDPQLRNDTTDEVVAGLDHQLGSTWVFGLSYIWRRYGNLRWNDRIGLTSDAFVAGIYTPSACPRGAACPEVTFYEPRIVLPGTTRLTNADGYTRRYRGLELSARKPMADRWMVDGSLTLQRAVNDLGSFGGSVNVSGVLSEDPTNRTLLADAPYGYLSAGNGLDDVFVNATWLTKVTGAVEGPWGMTIAGFFNARQGYPSPRVVRVPARAGGAGSVDVMLDRMGDVRLPTYRNLDLRLERPVRQGRFRLSPSLDVFNVFNTATLLSQRRVQNASNANTISSLVAPRIARLGVSLGW